jgi:hypothetical protein
LQLKSRPPSLGKLENYTLAGFVFGNQFLTVTLKQPMFQKFIITFKKEYILFLLAPLIFLASAQMARMKDSFLN